MQNQRKRMCATCIYQTGELEAGVNAHACHEHEHGDVSDASVACFGACAPENAERVEGPTPNAAWWRSLTGAEVISATIENQLPRSGTRKYTRWERQEMLERRFCRV